MPIKEDKWISKFKTEFDTELAKVIKQAEKEFGITPEVKIDYKMQLIMTVSGAGIQYSRNLTINPENSKKSRKPHLVAKNILRSIVGTQNYIKHIPHLHSRIYYAKYKSLGKSEDTYVPFAYMNDAVYKANMYNLPSPLEQYLQPTLSKQLKKEIAKL